MREILFRGKRTDNGEWVYGDFVNDWSKHNTKPNKTIYNNIGRYAVIPGTVGQYTGLTDKNGKKIFEGDILAFTDRLTEVKWHEICGCWDCSYIRDVDGKETETAMRAPSKWKRFGEVIGNIHDNPELLKEGVNYG